MTSNSNTKYVLQFDGIDDFVEISGFQWPEGGGPVTVEFWNKVNTGEVGGSAFCIGKEDQTNNRFQVHAPYDSGIFYWDYGDISGTGRIYKDYDGYLDKWTHVAVVSRGGGSGSKGMAIYLDGEEFHFSESSDGPTKLSKLSIGTLGDNNHKGKIADFRIWNRVRAQDEIAADMNKRLTGKEAGLVGYWPLNEGVGDLAADLTGNGNNGTLRGDVAWVIDTELPVRRPSGWYRSFPLKEAGGLTLEGGAGIVEDGRFGKCANLPDQTARLAPQENLSALGLDKPNFSLSIWVHLNAGQNSFSLGTATAKLRVDGEGAKLVSDDNPVADFPNADFPAGHWHYLAWVKTGDKHGLYLDGIKVGVKEASLAWSANDTLELALGNPGGRAAHLKCYPRALSEAEVLADYYTEVPTATESFVEQYPVDLAIANMAGPWEGYPDNKLFIVDDADNKVRQKIVLTNASGKAISLNATGKPDAAKDNLHFELRFRNATFSEPATYPKFDAPDGWSIQGPQQNSEDGSWSVYILSNSQRTLAADETLEFPFEYVTADSALGSRGTQVSLHYRNLAYDGGDPITGNRNKQVDILKVSATGGEFPLVALHEAPAGVVCDQECGQLHFYLYNRSDRTLTFSDNAEFRFVVPTGGGAGDLATDHTKTGRGADPLKKDTNASDGSSIFRWKPGANTEIQSGETVTLGITGCTPNAHPGVAIIDVEYQGLEGYPDGKLVAPVTKTTRDLAKLAGGGNVGIGTTDPSSALEIVSGRPNGIHVRGNVDKKVEPAVSTYLTLESEDDYRGRGVFLSHGSTSDGSKAAWFVGAPYKGGGLQVGYYSGSNSIYASAYKEQAKLFLTKEGNVGIGTTDPSKRLHVRENATDHAAIIENAAAGGYGLIVSAENDPLRVGGKDDPTGQSLIVKGDGKVGIGTTAPAEKLDVRGKLILGNDANEDLLTFRSERSWKFTAGGDGSGTSLDLQSLTNDKSFRILSPGGEAPLAVHVSDASDKSRVALGADLHVAKGRKIRIGDTKIDEDDLKILKKLASSKLTVQIKSGHGKYLDNYHGKANEGDNNRTIQFANSSAKGNWSLMTLIVSSG